MRNVMHQHDSCWYLTAFGVAAMQWNPGLSCRSEAEGWAYRLVSVRHAHKALHKAARPELGEQGWPCDKVVCKKLVSKGTVRRVPG